MQTPYTNAKVTSRHATAAGNTAVVITLAADADEIHAIHGIQVAYSAAPAGGLISVAIAGSTVFSDYVIGTNGSYEFTQPIYGAKNEAMVITLAAGGGVITGVLNAQTS